MRPVTAAVAVAVAAASAAACRVTPNN